MAGAWSFTGWDAPGSIGALSRLDVYDATTHAACRYRWTLDKGPPWPSRSDLRSLSDTPDQDPRKDPGPPAPGHDTLQPIHERDSSFKILSLRKRAPGPRLDAGRVVPQGVPQAVGNRVLRTPVFHDRGTDRSHDAPRGGPGKRSGAGFSPFWMDPGWIHPGSIRPRIPHSSHRPDTARRGPISPTLCADDIMTGPGIWRPCGSRSPSRLWPGPSLVPGRRAPLRCSSPARGARPAGCATSAAPPLKLAVSGRLRPGSKVGRAGARPDY